MAISATAEHKLRAEAAAFGRVMALHLLCVAVEPRDEKRTIMMLKSTTYIALGAVALAIGCNDPALKQRQADQARQEAAEKQQVELDKANVKLAEVRDETDKNIVAAHATAEAKQVEANDSLTKARTDARAMLGGRLDAAGKDITSMRSTIETKKGKVEAQRLETSLRTRSDKLRARLEELDDASTERLDATRKALLADIDALDTAIAEARR